jgi:hypothetical protein
MSGLIVLLGFGVVPEAFSSEGCCGLLSVFAGLVIGLLEFFAFTIDLAVDVILVVGDFDE